jgi:hypothetical protein
VSPLIVFAVNLVLGLMLMLIARVIAHGDRSSTRFAVKLFLFAVGLAFIGMYSAASIGGAGMQLSNAAFTVYGALLVGAVLVTFTSVGWGTLKTKIKDQGLMRRMAEIGPPWTDWGRGFMVCTGPLVLLPFLALSLANQALRRLACGCGVCRPLSADERSQCLTTVATRVVAYLRSWNWTKALLYANVWCWLVWGIKYGMIVSQIVFNLLIAALAALPAAAVLGLFVVIGLVMFLIPVVPGPLVYLTSGVLVVPVFEAAFGGAAQVGGACANASAAADANATAAAADDAAAAADLGPFGLACVVACLTSYALKLIAHVLQQKLIGERLASSVAIRAACAPNSKFMKALRVLLERPGLTLPKACMLCGGPDWPTSVLCGLLRVNCCQMVIGLTPMFLMTIPTTLAGAFATKSEPKVLPNLIPFMLAIVVLVQAVLGVGCIVFANRAMTAYAAEIAAIPDDEEVAAADERSKRAAKVRDGLTEFGALPAPLRAAFAASTGALVLTCYGLVFRASALFAPFSLTDCIEALYLAPYDSAIPGSTALGILALAVFVASLLVFAAFNSWAGRATRAALAAGGVNLELA